MWTENYAHLLFKCFFKQATVPKTKWVRWNSHRGSGMILNVDGSSLGNPDISYFEGLIQNNDDVWIHGFAGNINFSNILHAELLAIYYGLVMAWGFGITELWCYSDSKVAIKLISEPVNA
ncbi:ribonuclease H [Trifolium pratense]|uniref:Ribonuclease H n=1 Tax=Trifolium pratense TaxID=57577 RepID=A0A2K3NAE9_TRIPR|nr:ribonuclease H [Trifolium pratense]